MVTLTFFKGFPSGLLTLPAIVTFFASMEEERTIGKKNVINIFIDKKCLDIFKNSRG